jgi:hypothetical protein
MVRTVPFVTVNTVACSSQRILFYVTKPKPFVPSEGCHAGISTKRRVNRMTTQLEMIMEKLA